MVVDPGAPRAPLLAHAAQTFHVAVVVVRPDDRDVVGQFQPVGIDLQYLLVGCERLRDGLDRSVDVLGEDSPLVEQRLLEHPHLFVHGQRGRHGAVVQAAQRQRIDVLVGAVLAHALREHAVDTLLVLVVVPGPHRLSIPFAGGVQQQRFAVGRSHHDGERVGHELVFGDLVERGGNGVHGRGEVVGLEAQQQFADLGVGSGADVAALGLEGLRGPGRQTPVLVVEEDAAVAHRRRLGVGRRGVDMERRMFFHRNVGPPVPGGYADQLREREEPVGRAAAVAARDDEGFADARQGIGDGLDQVTLPGAFERGGVDLPRFGEPADEGAASDRPDDYRRACFSGRGGHLRASARYGLHVGSEELRRAFHHRGVGCIVEDRGRLAGRGEGEGVFGFRAFFVYGHLCVACGYGHEGRQHKNQVLHGYRFALLR